MAVKATFAAILISIIMEINKPVATIIILVIALITGFLFLLPVYQEFTVLKADLATTQSTYGSKSLYYAKISELLGKLESKGEALAKINSSLPATASFSPLVHFLQEKGTENGLIIKSIIFSPVSQQPSQNTSLGLGSDVKEIVFSVSMAGSYQGLKNFLVSLEKSARLFEVNTISFVSLESLQGLTKAKNGLQTYEFRLEIKTRSY